MSQFPPPPAAPLPNQGFQQPPAPKTNGVAIASLICGILGCVPFVTSLAAIILGVVGIGSARKTGSGKGMAIAGIILGILGILIWGGISVGGVWGYRFAQRTILAPTQTVAASFLNNLADGNITQAETFTTGDFSPQELTKLAAQVKTYGKFKDFTMNHLQTVPSGGAQSRFDITGTAHFENASKGFNLTVLGSLKDPTSFKIQSMTLE
jgi:hypothetical protein